MDRRKFLIAAGGTAIGASALVGSGAFSAAQIRGRDANIEVNGDGDALIQLIPGNEFVEDSSVPESRVFWTDDEELAISFDDEDGTGVNRNSTYQVGAIGERGEEAMEHGAQPCPAPEDVLYGENAGSLSEARADNDTRDDPAFVIRNAADHDIDVQLSYDEESSPDDSCGLLVMVGPDPNDDFGGGGAAQLAQSFSLDDDPINEDAETTATIPSGEWAAVSLIVKVGDADVDEPGWEGTLTLGAEEAVRQN